MGWSCVVCGRILLRWVVGGDVGRLVVVKWLGEVGWRWGWWFKVEVCGDVEMLGWIVKICVVKKSENPVINVSQYQSPLYPPLEN